MPSMTSKPRLWALVDCNSFYCSCERLFRPDLDGQPVVVLSNNDGCLIALTPEAKALGYKMGDVYHLLERQLKRDKVTSFSSNYTLYGDISRRVMMTLAGIAPVIDQYSIDEAFIPFDKALAANADEVGWEMHERVRKWVGVPVRVGLGSTRTLAKLANHWAKNKTRVYRLESGTDELEEMLERTPTEDIWGIGRRLSAKLSRMGIVNARQLRDMEIGMAKKYLTVVGQRTVMELRGVQCVMEEMPAPRKTMVSSRSFGRRVSRKEDIAQALTMHCGIAGERLRKEGLVAGAMEVWVMTSHHMDEPYCCLSAHVNLHLLTNITSELIGVAHEAMERCYEPGHGFMKGGIMLYELCEADRRQMTLMEAAVQPGQEKKRALMRALDKVNDKYGRDSMHSLSQGPSEAFWHMRRNKMSGLMTTQWKDLPAVQA
ncbi:SOS mutagenesis and repair protein UmuC [Deltaproteobacteria bacterium Smac51]|nr:SOS mutagenesis and repair protein UmuC [Deltaproteobacteria bacterium Smac51]